MAKADDVDKTFKWETLKGMPTKRVFSTPVESGDALYVVGGCDQMGTPIDAFEVMNGLKDSSDVCMCTPNDCARTRKKLKSRTNLGSVLCLRKCGSSVTKKTHKTE